jgi:hypothetical protein
MFHRVADDIWTTERPQRFWGVETGTRTTVVRLQDGGLFVHCPAALDAPMRAGVEALGEVRAVVASSLFHHLYVGEWMRAYPGALFCGCPGLEKKRADVAWGHILGDTPHPLWAGELEQVYLSARFEKEVVFFHARTRTMICADALLNLGHHPARLTRLAALFMWNTAPGKGWMERFAVQDWALGRRQVDRLLAWDIERIVLAHGALVDSDGRRVLREGYAWL